MIVYNSEKYKNEVKEKWGNTEAYQQHLENTKNYSKQKWDNLALEMDHIMAKFALSMKNGMSYDSLDVLELVEMLQKHITNNYYNCTNDILAGLGKMYVLDSRFKNNIDKHGEGTAEFISKAIEVYFKKIIT